MKYAAKRRKSTEFPTFGQISKKGVATSVRASCPKYTVFTDKITAAADFL